MRRFHFFESLRRFYVRGDGHKTIEAASTVLRIFLLNPAIHIVVLSCYGIVSIILATLDQARSDFNHTFPWRYKDAVNASRRFKGSYSDSYFCAVPSRGSTRLAETVPRRTVR